MLVVIQAAAKLFQEKAEVAWLVAMLYQAAQEQLVADMARMASVRAAGAATFDAPCCAGS